MKYLKKIIMLLLIAISFLFYSKVNAATTNIYNIYTDNTGVRWEYKYENTTSVKDIYIAFFDKPDSITSVTIPSLSTIKSSNSAIPSTINNITLINYFEIAGQTPKNITSNINTIDLTNVTNVDGVSPMLNKEMETKIIFSLNGTNIGNNVFEGAKLNLINLSTVYSIGNSAFKETILTDVNLKLEHLQSIGDGAFWGSNIQTVNINTEVISNNAFRECLNLSTVTLGDNVTKIGDGVFQSSTNFTTINFNNVKTIGTYSFKDCTSFTTDISNTKLEFIGDGAFYNTTSYKLNITIPSKVTNITYATFYGSGILSINLNNVTKIGSEAFSNCPNLSSINFGKVITIDYRAFYNDSSLTKVELSNTVEYIMTQAFSNCSISSLDLNKIQRIDYEAFANNNLKKIYLPKTFSHMTQSNIFNNNQITTVTVAYDTMSSTMSTNFRTLIGSDYKTITTLYVLAPYGEDEEVKINSNYGAQRKSYSGYFSADAKEIYGNANSYKNVIQPGYFYGLSALTNIIISEGYEFIGSEAFYTDNPYTSYKEKQKDQYKLTSVVLPSTLKGIGSMAFAANIVNENFKMNLPENLEYIGYQAFFNCPGFTNEINLKNLKVIGTNAFMYSGISAVSLYDNLTFVGGGAFKDCYNIKKFYIDCDLYSLPFSGDYGSNNNYTVQNFYSYYGKQQTYDSITFTEKVVTEPCGGFDKGYTSSSFMYRLKTKELVINSKWKNLGVSFLQEAEVDYLTLPNELEVIMKTAFLNAKIGNLVNMPTSVTTIGNDAFHGAIIKIDQLPKNLKVIGNAAFYECDFNANPIVPSGVTSIGLSAFMSTAENPIHRNSFTFECNLKAAVTNGQTVRQMLYNTTVDHLYFNSNVTDLPSSETKDTEFYNMPIKTVTFEGLKILPAKAFQDCKELISVDFSKDTNLEAINDLAFYNAEKLSKIKFPTQKNNITLGESSFRNTGFTSIGTTTASFDLTAANFNADSMYIFSEMQNLITVTIPNNFNNNEISEYTFWNCPNLKTVNVDYKINKIKSYAFSENKNLESIFFWGDTKIIQEDQSEEAISTLANNLIIYNNTKKADFVFTIIDSVKGKTTIKPSDFITDGTTSTYTYETSTNSKITFEYPEDISISITKLTDSYKVTINELNPSAFTIPSNTDIYAYSIYDIKEWDKQYENYRRSEKFATNATLYPLDEVLYLTSNKTSVVIDKEENDFDKEGLIVYALRRDGVILESSTWHEYSTHYLNTDSSIVFENFASIETPTKAQHVYNTFVPMNLVDISTQNFAQMSYELVKDDNLLHTKKVILYYTDKYTEHEVNTKLNPSLIGDIVDTGAFLNIIKFIIPAIIAIIITGLATKKRKLYKI